MSRSEGSRLEAVKARIRESGLRCTAARLAVMDHLGLAAGPRTHAEVSTALATLGFHPRIPVTVDDVADPATRDRWFRDHGMVVLALHSEQHADTSIDVFMREPFDVLQEHACADVAEIAPGVPLRIVRLATLLDMKRAAGREQDRADIAELSRLHGLGHG